MKEYPKIETLLNRDEKTFRVRIGEWRLPEFEYLKDCQWYFTEKVDGTNIRVMWDGTEIRWGGKTNNAQIPTFLITKLQGLFPVSKFQGIFPEPICLYGEGYGAKIQRGGGNYIPNGCDFVLLDVRIGDWWLQRKDVENIASRLNISVIPIIGNGGLMTAVDMAEKGFNSQWGNFPAEGIVVRPMVELSTRSGHRIIGKIKSKDFSGKI